MEVAVKALEAGDPQQIGKYRLLGRLGGGGMGRVFLGQSPGGRLVAVKLIRPDLASDDDFRARFAREVRAARKVSGIFTAPVVDADPDAPQPWLVTEYVQGPSLAVAVAAVGPLPIRSVLLLAAGLAEGLSTLHAAGVVHRDLKPSNVLLADDGPRIIDFGISRASDATPLTGADVVIGSPGFMSPEQAEGHEAGPSSDVFSLGSVLTFAATGEGPFGSGPATALLYRVVHAHPAIDRLPTQIRPLIARCLAKDPQSRPTTDRILAELASPQLAGGWLPAGISQVSREHQRPDLAAPDNAGFPTEQMPTEPVGAVGWSAAAADPMSPRFTGRRQAPDAGISLVQESDTRKVTHRWPRWHLSRAWAVAMLAVVVVLVPVLVLIFNSSAGPPAPTPTILGPSAVVEAFYAAINDHNWPRVWQLGGKNLGTPYQVMIAGYRTTARDVITSLTAKGTAVSGGILAYQTTGAVRTYRIYFVVQNGVIKRGHQTLLKISHPLAGQRFPNLTLNVVQSNLRLGVSAETHCLKAMRSPAIFGRSAELGHYLMVRDPLVPAAQRPTGGVLDDGLLVIVSGKAADGVQAVEERDGGEQDLPAILVPQQAGAPKSADRAQVLADLGFVMTLVVIGGGQRSPAAPYPRDHVDPI